MKNIKTAVFGGSGYTGLELIRILDAHPATSIGFATSRTYAGKSARELSPKCPDVELVSANDATFEDIDVAFLCLPHAAAAETAIAALDGGCRVVDLSADFRLRDASVYEKWYDRKHPKPELLEEAVYGLTEYARDGLGSARLVANPGCYPTSILLAVKPLLSLEGDIVGPIIADSKSGVTGAGRKPKVNTLFAELSGNFYPYKIGQAHRHYPEIQQGIDRWRKDAPDVLFSPHLLPVRRGILSTIYVTFDSTPPLDELQALYDKSLGGEPFVEVLPPEKKPTLEHVTHTNLCAVSLSLASSGACSTVVVTSAIDNLVKGAAGQAVQNMNVMFGLEETAGLIGTIG
jgi:N-acetyl-gamma-glutamyl-phosphate reductase